MDRHTFHRMIQRPSGPLSRRSVVGTSMLAILGLGDVALARKTRKGNDQGQRKSRAQSKKTGSSNINRATAEGQLGEGARSPRAVAPAPGRSIMPGGW